jgi:hypothetical protein
VNIGRPKAAAHPTLLILHKRFRSWRLKWLIDWKTWRKCIEGQTVLPVARASR